MANLSLQSECWKFARRGEIVEFLEQRQVDVCCVQETRWRGKSVRIEGKNARYKLFVMGNDNRTCGVGIFFGEKWLDAVIDVNRVSDHTVEIDGW